MWNHKIYLQYVNAILVQNKVWFVDGESNGLFTLDLRDFSVEFIEGMSCENKDVSWAYLGNIHCYYEDKLFLFPSKGNQVLVYDIRQNKMVGIPYYMTETSEEYIIASIVQSGVCVWIFPSKMEQGVYVLDLEAFALKRYLELDEALEGIEHIDNIGNVVKMSETKIAILSGKHTVIGVDIVEKKRIFSKRFDKEINIWGIRHSNGSFWLLLYDSTDVYEWIQSADTLVKYKLLEEEWISGKGVPYSEVIFFENRVILLPCTLKYITKVNFAERTIVKATEYPIQFCFFDCLSRFSVFSSFDFLNKNKVLLYPLRGNMLLTYDVQRNLIEGRESTVVIDEIPYLMKEMRKKLQEGKGILQENDGLSVGMLDLLADGKTLENSTGNKKSIGKRIYDDIAERK